MCRFCSKQNKEVEKEVRSRKGRLYRTKVVECVNPSWEDAPWESRFSCQDKFDDDAPMDITFDTDENKVMFSYDAYSCDSSFEAKLSINFCPFCGRKLKKQ